MGVPLTSIKQSVGWARKQSGAVLIIAIFVLAVAAVMITGFTSEYLISVRRAENQQLSDKAWQYLRGAEDLATQYLIQESSNDRTEGELISFASSNQFPTDDGWLAYEIIETEAALNLNNLYSADNTDPVPNTEHQRRFVRLLVGFDDLSIGEQQAIALTEAIVDWLDPDSIETGFGGAEVAGYASEGLNYQPPNGPMREISELILVSGITPQIYERLVPLVTVWPQAGGNLNVAAAKPETLAALYTKEGLVPLSQAEVAILYSDIDEKKLTTLSEFLERPEWGEEPLSAQGLTASGTIFRISSQTQVGRIRQGMDTIVKVENGQATVLARKMRML